MPEQADDGDEEAKAADLDALLELFREPEEPPRKKVSGAVWMFLALVLAMVAIWLAARVATSQLVGKSDAEAMKPTKIADREQRKGEGITGDVVEDYIARCKKGITAKEVRWIVEDFEKAGLGGGPGSLVSAYDQMARNPPDGETLERLAMKLGKRQRSWYADAIQQALRLDASQSSFLNQSLDKALEGDRGMCLELRADYLRTRDVRSDPEWAGIEFNFLARPSSWLIADSYRPEKLVNLSEAQARVSWFNNWIHDAEGNMVDPFPANPEVRMVDFSGIRMRNHEANASPESTWFVTQEDLQAVAGMASLAALTKDQDYRGGGITELAKVLHPAQLKILLLLDPEAAGEIASELDKAAE